MAEDLIQGEIYSVTLSENEWYAPEVDKAQLVDNFKATMIAKGCSRLVVFVKPDAIFSISPNLRKHRVVEYVHPTKIDEQFTVTATFIGTIDALSYAKAPDAKLQNMIVRRCRDAIVKKAGKIGGKYTIHVSDGRAVTLIEQGRV